MKRLVSLFAGVCVIGTAATAAPWTANEFPIACWRGPRPAQNTLENYRILRECGFNIVGPTGGYTPEQNRELLLYCRQAGLKAIVCDPRIAPATVLRDDWQKVVADVVKDYSGFDALYGYYLLDEPSSMLFDPLGMLSRELERLDPDHLPYINLLPTYANTKQLGTPTYEEHLIRFIETASPRLLSYDHYALRKAGGVRSDYYENMALVQEASRRSGIPWWYVHYSGAYSGYRAPTEAEMRWQVYTSLAYGAKGISYWYYWGRNQEGDERTGVVDPDGKPTWLYPILQRLNHETQILGNILLPMDCTEVYHVGDIPPGTRRMGTEALVKLPDDAPLMAGIFRDDAGEQAALVVNRDATQAVDVAITFLPHVARIEQVSSDDGSTRELTRNEEGAVNLKVSAGGGTLLRLETAFDYPKPPETLTAIDFQFDGEDMEGWGGLAGLSNPQVKGGTLTMNLGARDPHFHRTHLRIAPDTYRALRLRMRVTGGSKTAQVFWTTGDEPVFADTRYMNFDIVPDGKWHEYEIPLATHERWAGKEIRALRIDPSTGGAQTGDVVEIDWITGVP
jgi:hypothetical protein